MPKPSEGESQKEFVSRCIPIVMDEGTAKDNKQAAAICFSMWRESKKSGSVCLSMTITKTSKMDSGCTRWRAKANTGEVDIQNERFDVSFWRDIVNNFYRVKEAIWKYEIASNSKGIPLPVPILDLAHYCFYLQDRNKSRAGWIENVWTEGKEFYSEGYFDETPLGKLAAKAAALPEGDRPAISIGVWPDWSKTAVEDGVFVYRGGDDVAYLDHEAMTKHPVNQGTDIGVDMETKSTTVAEDAIQVLGQDGEDEVKRLEAARLASKSDAVPEGAVIKTDGDKPEVSDAKPVAKPEPKPEIKAEDGEPIEINKAYPNEHAARVKDPGEFRPDTFRRKEVSPGISLIMGKLKSDGDSMVTQAYRFSKDKFTPEEARKWLQDHDIKAEFEAAKEEKKSETFPDLAEMKMTLATLVEAMNAVNGMAKSLTELSEKVDAQAKELQSLKATDEVKVKSALDGGGIWGALNLYSPRTDSTNVVKSVEVKGPEVTEQPQDGIWGMMAKPKS